MKILLIEDDEKKAEQIITFLRENFIHVSTDIETSYNHGLRTILQKKYDLLLLDMSLPTFEITIDELGGKPMSFAGEEILRQLSRRKIEIPTIVITQYERFEKGLSLNQLKNSIKEKNYSNYIDTIYYNTTNNSWKKELIDLLKNNIGLDYQSD